MLRLRLRLRLGLRLGLLAHEQSVKLGVRVDCLSIDLTSAAGKEAVLISGN